MDRFVNLHVHDEYSPLDGAGKISSYVERAVELKQPALAQTNHGYLLGTHNFWKECRDHGIKPILGLEAYVSPGIPASRRGQTFWGTKEQRRQDVSGNGAYTHLTLLASGPIGLRNLYHLSSRSFAEGFYQKPRVDLGMLEAHREGIIILSGCLSSELLTRLALGQYDEANSYVRGMKETFGDNFYIEVMDHGFEAESKHLRDLYVIANMHNVPCVATSDCHYVNANDKDLHDAMLCLKTYSKLTDPDRMGFDGNGYHLCSRAEMEARCFPPAALDMTLEIADRILPYDEMFKHVRRMPDLGVSDSAATLRETCEARLSELDTSTEYLDRLEYELEIIIGQGFQDYFLVTAHAVRDAREAGIWVGPGRGSAAGSLVAYLLGITGLDPVKHGLLFERFLNPERISPPDIDTDFQASRRGEVFAREIQRHGAERCARIATTGTIGAKKAIEDACRVLGHQWSIGNELKKLLPPPVFGREASLDSIKSLIPDDPVSQEIYTLAKRFEGFVRGTGMHAGGFIISPVPLADVVPTFIPERGNKEVATQFDMRSIDELGLIKIDFLGLAMGDVIKDACDMAGCELPDNLDDEPTFELLRRGDTRAVFQLDSIGMRALLRRLGARDFGDIAAVVALYRPGPMGANAHVSYADRRNGKEVVRYPHPSLAGPLQDILAPTYGLFVFQEQIMQAIQRVCGYTLAQSDLVRKAMGKKDRDLLQSEYARFMQGGLANGYGQDALGALWEVLVPFADYSFNKAHAYGYAILAYWTAWLKTHHPRAYMAAILSHESDPAQAGSYVAEVNSMGIPILAPSVNGGASWTPTKEGLLYGLTSIRGVGDKAAAAILGKAPYADWADYLRRVPKAGLNVGVVRALAESGALDCLGQREAIRAKMERHLQLASEDRENLRRGDVGFGQRTYYLPTFPVDYRAREHGELTSLGTRLSAQPVHIRANTSVQECDWEFLRTVADRFPGKSRLTVSFGSWELDTGLSVNRDQFLPVLGANFGETELG